MMKKVIAVLCITCMCVSNFVACSSTEDEGSASESSSDYDGTVYWLNYKPEVSEQMQLVAEAYTEETGIDVKIETAASGEYESTLSVELDKSDSPSIFVVDSSIMFSTWESYCADLAGTELDDMLANYDYIFGEGDEISAISYSLENWGIIVNKTILEAYFELPEKATDITSIEELYTFDNLQAVVEDMQLNKELLGIEGVFGSTSLQSGDDWRYQTHLLNQSAYWEWDSDIDITGAVPDFTFEYSDGFQNILDLYLNNSVIDPTLVGSKTVDDSMAEFALGQCAMIQNGDWAWSTIEGTDNATVTADDVTYLPISIGVDGEEEMGLSTGASQYMCVNSQKSEEDQQAAIDFLVWLFSSETGTELVAQELQFVTPFATMADAEYINPLFASANEMVANGQTSYPWVISLIPSQTWKDDFGADLLQYAQGQMDWDTVVEEAVDTWAVEKELLEEAIN